jgi:hypothetical protein
MQLTRASRILLLLMTLVGACRAGEANDAAAVAVDNWLTCEECTNGELARVRQLGAGTSIPLLSAALVGPAPSAMGNLARSSAAGYARARRYSLTLTPPERALRPLGDSATFVARTVDRFKSLYQHRAVHALVVIDPARARVEFRRRLVEDSLANGRIFRPALRALVDSLARAP